MVVKICTRDTLYPSTGLPTKSGLVGTHVCCLLRDRRRAALFLSCRGRLRPSSYISGKPLVFHQKDAFQVLQIRFRCLYPGNYRASNLNQQAVSQHGCSRSQPGTDRRAYWHACACVVDRHATDHLLLLMISCLHFCSCFFFRDEIDRCCARAI